MIEKLPRVSVEAFEQYHADNPGIYAKLVTFAMEAARAGAKHIGIGMLFERLRWYSVVESKGDPFKLNNNYRAFYARKLMAERKALEGLFETRTSVADNAGPRRLMKEIALQKTKPAPVDNRPFEQKGSLFGDDDQELTHCTGCGALRSVCDRWRAAGKACCPDCVHPVEVPR